MEHEFLIFNFCKRVIRNNIFSATYIMLIKMAQTAIVPRKL